MDRDIIEFVKIASRLKEIKRKGWIKKVNVNPLDRESVADHSYLTALLVTIIGDIKELDSCKAIKMALIHDLAESIIGDYTPDEIDDNFKKNLEDEVMLRLFKLLPKKLREEYTGLWKEYLENCSKEANIVHQIDKFEMFIQAKMYEDKGYPSSLLKEFYDTAYNYINDKELREMMKSLKEDSK